MLCKFKCWNNSTQEKSDLRKEYKNLSEFRSKSQQIIPDEHKNHTRGKEPEEQIQIKVRLNSDSNAGMI